MERQKFSSAYIIYGEDFVSKSRFLIRQIVEAASIKAAVTVGVNVPLTFGKETGITNFSGMSVTWKTLKD